MEAFLRGVFVTACTVVFVGCTSTSRVHFEEPIGSRIYLEPQGMEREGQEFTLPAALDLPQKESPQTLNSDLGGRPVSMRLGDGTKLKGYLYVYKIHMDQVERLAEVTFRLSDDQIRKLKSGQAVTVLGYSARKQPVYKINLGLDR